MNTNSHGGPILLCLDGSAAAAKSIPYAIAMARAFASEVIVLGVLEENVSSHPRAVDTLANELARQVTTEYLDKAQEKLESLGLVARTRLLEGNPATQIIQVADAERASLVILASHGSRESLQFRLGGTADKVAQHVQHSVLVTPSQWSGDFERILVLLDGSQAAQASLAFAQIAAKANNAELILAHVACRPELPMFEPLSRTDVDLLDRLEHRRSQLARDYLQSLERSLRQEGLTTRTLVVSNNDKRQGALDLVREVRADLVVVASHGHTASQYSVHGSLTEHLLSYSPVPIWVVQNMHRQTESYERAVQS